MVNSEILERASAIYEKELWNSPVALNYLTKERGLKEREIKRFKLGYASFDLVLRISEKEGWINEARKIGLVNKYNHDFFNGCITIPLLENNEHYNMSCRGLKNGISHKCLPDLPKRSLFNQTEIIKSSYAILVESPIDAITLEQNGFNSCASLGAKINQRMADQLLRKHVYILFDYDEAGRNGALLAAERLISIAKNVFIVEFPDSNEKMDANLFFRKYPNASKRLKFLLKNSRALSRAQFGNKPKEIKKYKKVPEDKISIVELGRVLFQGEKMTDKENELWVRCPHHKEGTEKKESLWIGGKKNIFYCFGCSLGGGPVYLVKWHLKLSSIDEAIKWIRKHITF